MTESLAEWLELREAADWASRSEMLVQRARESFGPVDSVSALDLCTGTGSNLRYLMDRLPPCQRWLVVDRDSTLLAEVPAKLSAWALARGCTITADALNTRIRGDRLLCDVEVRQMDLEHLDEALFEGRHLVTASALLDLVSEQWLRLLAARCHAAGATALFSVTYNGRSSCDPVEPEDDWVRELMNSHQRTDKGLGGPAAGAEAWIAAERAFEHRGYRVERAASDWTIGPSERMFQRRLIEGWAQAAGEIAPTRSDAIAAWLRRRLNHLDAGRSRIVISHADMVAWLDSPVAGRWPG